MIAAQQARQSFAILLLRLWHHMKHIFVGNPGLSKSFTIFFSDLPLIDQLWPKQVPRGVRSGRVRGAGCAKHKGENRSSVLKKPDFRCRPLCFTVLMASHRAIRLRSGHGRESCDANGPRNTKNTNLAKQSPRLLLPLLPVGSLESA